MFDWAALKVATRRTVNETFGVQAFYSDASVNPPIEFRARPHTKTSKPFGGLVDGDGYADVIEGVDRIVFFAETIDGATFVPQRLGEIQIPSLFPTETFILDTKLPTDGPLTHCWQVTRK